MTTLFSKHFIIQRIDEKGNVDRPVMVTKTSWFERYGIPIIIFIVSSLLGYVMGYFSC